MDAIEAADSASKGRRAVHRRWWSDSLAMLLTVDVMAFAAAAWLILAVPEAFDEAANGANLGAVALAGSTPIARPR